MTSLEGLANAAIRSFTTVQAPCGQRRSLPGPLPDYGSRTNLTGGNATCRAPGPDWPR